MPIRAVFLDRDGCINNLVIYPGNGEYEAPYSPEDVVVPDGTAESIRRLQDAGFLIFVVSNQAGYAKGKASMEAHLAVSSRIETLLRSDGVDIAHVYYCYHHPKGVVPELSISCDCRKPGEKFLLHARDHYGVSLSDSWMIGDSDTDIECGQRAGCQTISISNPLSVSRRGSSSPTLKADNLPDAVVKLLSLDETK